MSQVTEHLDALGIPYEVLPHERAVTAEAEAHSLQLDAHQVVKTVVLDVRTGHAFAVVPADAHVDLDRVRAVLNSRHVELATEEEIARDYPEFELGAIPPLGALTRTPVIVDPSVIEQDEVVFAAGSQRESVKVAPRALFEGCTPKVAPILQDAAVPV